MEDKIKPYKIWVVNAFKQKDPTFIKLEDLGEYFFEFSNKEEVINKQI